MASASSKTLIDIFDRASKRLKPTLCKSEDATNASSTLSIDQKSRIEYNKNLALSKRNLKICIDRVSKHKESLASGCVKLEELLVEESWLEALSGEFQKSYLVNLAKFVETEICSRDDYIYPPQHLIFNALNTTPFHSVKAVILGQDPYHGPGQAMGLSFSVPEGVKVPSSLVNIFKELKQDLGCSVPSHGNLEKWAVQHLVLHRGGNRLGRARLCQA
ncbi:uracil-DNA glycosylase-like protein [Trifolium pratense]|uniref:Uracil-DNA glycosylase-like protein n=1 Tax=Trifolium pratense TaxID=57577 RepID=A0A2K3JK70_TRIPR|nr:uracil-DNA glycosylase-like protein [Trifolium pratense]